MATNQEWLQRIRRKYFSKHSDAADWWDKLTPEWRGVVLHAAAVTTREGVFKVYLNKCCWQELCERIYYRAMIQSRTGIFRARLTCDGFGSFRDADFLVLAPCGRCSKNVGLRKNEIQMVCAPHIVNKMLMQQEGKP